MALTAQQLVETVPLSVLGRAFYLAGKAERWRNSSFAERQSHARMMAIASARAARCPWCGLFNRTKVQRRAHAMDCPKRPADADPSIYGGPKQGKSTAASTARDK